jgi:D-arabinose 1-dehydrogenase-like Zn-dependent alcohol dehydrogenase
MALIQRLHQCAGLTMYSPLVRQNVGPGSKVGIVGLGGLVSLIASVTQGIK